MRATRHDLTTALFLLTNRVFYHVCTARCTIASFLQCPLNPYVRCERWLRIAGRDSVLCGPCAALGARRSAPMPDASRPATGAMHCAWRIGSESKRTRRDR